MAARRRPRLPIEEICRALAREGPPPALAIPASEVAQRLPEACARLAQVAFHTGAGEEWALWCACARAAEGGLDAALSRLPQMQAFWLAAWAFQHGEAELGLRAHERYLALSTAPPNHFRDFVYFHEATRRGEALRALEAFEAVRAKVGCNPPDEVWLAACAFLARRSPPEALRKALERFERDCDPLVRAAVAVGFDALEDREGVRRALSVLGPKAALADFVARAMRERLGDAFARAAAGAPTPPPARRVARRAPGLVAMPSAKATAHRFAPEVPPGPACPGCRRPMPVYFALDVPSIPALARALPGWKTLQAPACLACDAWMVRHDYQVGPDGRPTRVRAPSSAKGLGKTRALRPARAPAPQYVALSKAPARLRARPLDGDCQVGGEPAWIQEPVEVACPGCNEPMAFALRFSSPNGFEGGPPVGDSGALYYFACPRCRRLSCVAQWS